MRNYWYFSRNGKYPKNSRVIETWRIGGLGALVEVRTRVLSNEEIKQCDMSFIGFLTIRELIGSHLFIAAGVNTESNWTSR